MKLGTNDIGSVYLGTNAISSIYLGTNLVWSGMDPDYKAILDYATTQGYTLPSESQRLLQEQLIIDLKAAGVWSKLDTFAVFATDGNSDFALIDWKRLSQYTAVNSPTFTTNQGFKGNGTSSFLDTNWNAVTNGVNFQLNNAGIVCYVFSASGNGPFTGVASGNNQGATNSTAATMRINTTQSLNATVNMVGNGYTAVHKTSSLNLTFTKGTNQQNRTVTTDNSFNESHFILRRGSGFGAHTISFASYGANMESYDSTYNTILTNYINAL
jgi:hypothetical protein